MRKIIASICLWVVPSLCFAGVVTYVGTPDGKVAVTNTLSAAEVEIAIGALKAQFGTLQDQHDKSVTLTLSLDAQMADLLKQITDFEKAKNTGQ